jgi:Lon protease-like protein
VADVAMFPLGKVLVPGEILPLHVFEPRYRQLVVDLLADDDRPPEFGVVLIERGWEVGGGDARSDVGTIARIVDVQAFDGGRYGLLTLGVRRVRVVAWRDDDPYPRADVEDWIDEPADEDLGERLAATARRIRDIRVRAVAAAEAAAGDQTQAGPPDGPDGDVADPVLASYRLTAVAPIGPADAYRALCAPGPGARLDVLSASLDDVEAMLRFRLGDGA